MEERCNYFANKGTNDPSWAFNCIVKFLQYQKERVEQEEITGATLRNFIKAIKLFCEMSDISIQWKKITRGLPKIRRHADDRSPKLEEIQQLCEYLDRRIKGIVYTMASSGIRLGALDYLRWKDIQPIERQGKVIADSTMAGPNTFEIRQLSFEIKIDLICEVDQIYRAGVEIAPLLKNTDHKA